MHNGYSALNFSAEYGLPPDKDPRTAAKSSGAGGPVMTIATLFAVGLFIAVPHLLTWGLSKLVGPTLDTSGPWFHLVGQAGSIGLWAAPAMRGDAVVNVGCRDRHFFADLRD